MELLETTAAFTYLDFTVAFNNSNWVALYRNLRKSQQWWWMLKKLLTKTGATVQAQAMMYKALVQTVLIYESETWVVMDEMLKVLEGFHHQVAWSITGMSA